MPDHIYWYLFSILCCIITITDGILDKRQHQTNASLEKNKDLSCFECSSLYSGEECSNLSVHNKTKFQKKCDVDKKKCMVKKISYTTSTENSTSHVKLWSLERNCTNKCENGCIIIGERTKLHACTTCCDGNLCNVTNDATSVTSDISWLRLFYFFIFIIMFDVPPH